MHEFKKAREFNIRSGFLFFLFNAIALSLLSFRYLSFIQISGAPAYIYLILTSIGHFTLISLVCFGVLYYPMCFIRSKINWPIYWAVFLSTILLFWVVLDTFVFGLYRFHINGFVLGLIFGGAFQEIFQLHFSIYLMALVSVMLFLILEFALFRFSMRLARRYSVKSKLKILLGILVTLLVSNLIYAASDALNYNPILSTYKCYPLHYPLTAKKWINKNILHNESGVYLELDRPNKNNALSFPLQEIQTSRSDLNVLWIVLDSWSYKCMDSLVSPNIYSFSKRCAVFKNHISGSNGTREGIFSLFYGLPGLYWDDFKAGGIRPTLVDEFIEHEYAINTFPSSSLKSPEFNLTVFSGLSELALNTEGKRARDRDINLTENWLKYTQELKSPDTPFFSFLFFDSMHAMDRPDPYVDPFQPTWPWPQFHLLNNDLDPTEFYNLYRNCTHFVDGQVGRVLKDLEEKNLMTNTVVMITGDHGQEFNEHKLNYWGHNGNFSIEQIGTPMMLFFPNKKDTIIQERTTHYDVSATLLEEVFQCTNPPSDYSNGNNMFFPKQEECIIVGSKWKFGVLETDRITTMDYDGSFNITDLDLVPIPNKQLRAKKISHALRHSSRFYLEPQD